MDPIEDVATQVPMISRILQLLMIDILTVGVALRRPAQGSAEAAGVPGAPAPKTLAAAPSEGLPPMPGVSTASPPARMTLHRR